MKKVYVAHSRVEGYDFKKELYQPIRESSLNGEFEIILPHEESDNSYSSKEFFRDKCDVIVVEASYRKVGPFLEVGCAWAFDVPIIVLIKKGVKLSGSLNEMGKTVVEYENPEEMISGLEKALEGLK